MSENVPDFKYSQTPQELDDNLINNTNIIENKKSKNLSEKNHKRNIINKQLLFEESSINPNGQNQLNLLFKQNKVGAYSSLKNKSSEKDFISFNLVDYTNNQNINPFSPGNETVSTKCTKDFSIGINSAKSKKIIPTNRIFKINKNKNINFEENFDNNSYLAHNFKNNKKNNNLDNLNFSPIKSIKKNYSKEKNIILENKSKINPNKSYISNNPKDFLKNNNKIIFTNLSDKIIHNSININENVEFDNILNLNNLENTEKINSNNLSNINFSGIYFPEFPAGENVTKKDSKNNFVFDTDGMSNIMLNKEKNLNIVNLDKLYQGSFNREFCELYGNTENDIINNNKKNSKQLYEKNNKNNLSNSFSHNTIKKSFIKNCSINKKSINIRETNFLNKNKISEKKIKSPIKKDKENINNPNHNSCDLKHFDKLNNFKIFYENKIENIRNQENEKKSKSAKPEITKKAKKIIREEELFHCRLYPFHKISKSPEKIKSKSLYLPKHTYYSNNHKNINFDNLTYYNSINNNTSLHVIENLRRLEGIEDIQTYKIYRTTKKDDLLNFGNYEHEEMNKNESFTFKPALNNNSLHIAEGLTPSNLRLKAKKFKPVYLNDKENKSFIEKRFNYSLDSFAGNLMLLQSPYPKTRENSKRENKHKFDLYKRGLEKIKKKQALFFKKKKDEQEIYKQFTYKPKINEGFSPLLSGRRNFKNQENPENNNKIIQDNYFAYKPQKIQKYQVNFYDKNLMWKQNVERKNQKIKEDIENNIKNIHTFKPEIIKNKIPNDEKFIEKNIEQIQEYVNKRRLIIQKSVEENKYKQTKYHYGENYKFKPTIQKEFNLSCSSHLKDNNKINVEFNNKKKNSENKNYLKFLRNSLKINDFFENNNSESNKENDINEKNKNDGIKENIYEDYFKNKKFNPLKINKLNRSFNNLSKGGNISKKNNLKLKNSIENKISDLEELNNLNMRNENMQLDLNFQGYEFNNNLNIINNADFSLKDCNDYYPPNSERNYDIQKEYTLNNSDNNSLLFNFSNNCNMNIENVNKDNLFRDAIKKFHQNLNSV